MIDVFHLEKTKAFGSPLQQNMSLSQGIQWQSLVCCGEEGGIYWARKDQGLYKVNRLFRVSVSQYLFTLATRLHVEYLRCMRDVSEDLKFIWFSLPW